MAIERATASGDVAAASAPTDTEAPPVQVIPLENGEHRDSTLYRFERGTILRFAPGPSLLGRKVFLYTNYVTSDTQEERGEEQAEFVRNQYYGLEWHRAAPPEEWGGDAAAGDALGAGVLLTDTDAYCQLRLGRAGCYHYYFVYDSAESAVGPAGSGWFQVSPTLRVGPGGRETLPLDAVACQTVLTKCLGPLPRWESVLRVAKESGYNMLHFTPIQELGASRSSYSIADRMRLDPQLSGDGREATFADVEALTAHMRSDWRMLSICDVVLNHTANETPWLAERPEATYNCAECPHLRPAALLDALLARVGGEIARGDHVPAGVPPAIATEDHVAALERVLRARLPDLRLHELYSCDAARLVRQFREMARAKLPARGEGQGQGDGDADGQRESERLRLTPDPQRRRLQAQLDLEAAARLFNVHRADCYDEEARLDRCCEELRAHLDRLNEEAGGRVREHLQAALANCLAGVRWQRVQSDGPRAGPVCAAQPLVPRYFTFPLDVERCGAAEAEAAVFGAAGALVMAHNGWVMEADPLQDFAAREADGRVYVRRELIAWGDSVKLRFGARPEDSPFLWAHMREYVELTAELFDGLRIDNCHSTPLHVAEYMLDCARNVKPDLYVAAELFTNSDHVDNIFVNRLGITALIREAQSAWDAHEQGRLVHRFGGRPVGAFLRAPLRPRPAAPCVARAMLLDLTHDNPSPLEKRCLFDMLPTAAVVAMACCASGSTRGYDELVPHHVHVVDESRLYPAWSDAEPPPEGHVGPSSGIVAAKRALNDLHAELAAAGYEEAFVDQMDADVVAVTRHDPRSRRSVVLVSYTAFSAPEPEQAPRTPRPLRFEGQLEEIALELSMRHEGARPYEPPAAPARHPRFVSGLAGYRCEVRRAVPLAQSAVFAGERRDGGATVLDFRPLGPGAVAVVRVAPRPHHAAALLAVERSLAALSAPAADPLGLDAALAELELTDFNALLYRCEAEERECGGGGTYDVPGWGALPYAGLQGAAALLAEVTPRDDLGHPLCENLRAGDWLAEHLVRRLEADSRLAAVAGVVREALRPLAELPRYLVPAHFAALLQALFARCVRAALGRMSGAARADSFSRALALTSVQLTAALRSAPLPPLSPALPPPRPLRGGSLSAGLPHFATGYMRCWGRDTFVALRGMFLLTGRYQDARTHILGFAACLRHGLIPNLLDGGRNARYNCRDAVWWWLQSIKQYCCEAPHGHALLAEPVARLFPSDDAEPAPPGVAEQPLHDLMQEALDVHFQGLAFRERNAGRAIDAHMSDKGFNMQIGVDPDTGFPFGGNDANCGTWMDKMGSSDRAGTRGRPATPRDGSAVELVGLAYSVLAWLAAQHRAQRYPYPGVVRKHRDAALTHWTYAQWAERIRANFERHFWVPATPSAADARPDLVHRRCIYKDSHGATRAYADYQLRCNFPIAMAVAPELFDARHAWAALDTLERLLVAPLGVRTLDPADWAFRANYRNSDDSEDGSVAHGFNYHQGPEWVWPLGFYLRARLAFAHEAGKHARTVASCYRALGPLLRELRGSAWRGLPELTDAGGAVCADSCRTQAWSSAVVLEVLHDLEAARRSRPLATD